MSSTDVAPALTAPSPLANAGAVIVSLAKHVVVRAVLWAALGLVSGVASFAAFLVIYRFADRSGVIALALLGLYVSAAVTALGAHGVTRGVARAALELEKRFGLSRYLIDRVTGSVERRFGATLANLPLATIEEGAKQSVTQLLGTDDMLQGSGATRWVLRKVRALVVRKIEVYLLKAFRAEAEGGTGVSIARVRERLHAELPDRLSSIVMGTINKHLAVIVVAYLALALGWPAVFARIH